MSSYEGFSRKLPGNLIYSFHHPLLKKIAQTSKPVIMSTGIADISEIIESVQVLKDNGCSQITLLKCTSTYPSTPENTNLATIPVLQQIFPDCITHSNCSYFCYAKGISDWSSVPTSNSGALDYDKRAIRANYSNWLVALLQAKRESTR